MEEKEERAGVKRAVKITPATASQSGRSAWEFQTKRKGRRFHHGSLQFILSIYLPGNASSEQVQLQSHFCLLKRSWWLQADTELHT